MRGATGDLHARLAGGKIDMKNLRIKSIFLLAVLVLFVLSIWPPSEKLRLGKDLRGGTTLVYSVDIDPGENPKEVLDKVIEVLKDRVDPQGIFDITMMAQGQDRIEITMPLPSDKVKALKADFEQKLNALDQHSISRGDFERIMRLPAEERSARIIETAGQSGDLRTLLDDAAAGLDEATALREQLRMMEQQAAPDEAVDAVVAKIADAELKYERSRDAALAAMPTAEEFRRLLDLPDRELILKDERTGQYVTQESSRKRALDKFRQQHDGRLKPEIDAILAAYETYLANRTSLDDPSDLVRLLRGAGVLSFRITVDPQGSGSPNTHPDEQRLRAELREKGPRNVRARDVRWVKINRIEAWLESVQELEMLDQSPEAYFARRGLVAEEYDGDYWVLAWDTPGKRLTQEDDSDWAVASAFNSADQSGRPAIGFRMDTRGANLFGSMTGGNIGNKMAVLLDDEVYTAPVIQARITRNGIITGNFSTAEREYVIRVLNAGSLQAKLSSEPLSESTIAPELGLDNLRAGLISGLIAFVVAGGFMIVYYFGLGVVAVVGLLINALLILGSMSLAQAAFSLPGIAGVILTFGMAVDANVLIYERMREELERGADLKTAVRLGFERAMSSIVDGNVTNLIVCVVLGQMGTAEIRGFAITLGIGVCTTLFAALFVSRIMLVFLADVVHIKKMRMLPMVYRPLGRALEPNIKWLSLRWMFLLVSITYVGIGVYMVATRGDKMLDMEFRGGVQVTMQFGTDQAGQPIIKSRAEVLDEIRRIGEGLSEEDPLRALTFAEVVPVNPIDGINSNVFNIKCFLLEQHAGTTTSLGAAGAQIDDSPTDRIVKAIVSAFEGEIETKAPVEFAGSQYESVDGAPVYEIVTPHLGEAIRRPEYRENVASFIGGAAIVINVDQDPGEQLPTLRGLHDRISTMRAKPDFVETMRHRMEIRVLDGTEEAVKTAVVLVADPELSFFDNPDVWRKALAEPEWDLVRSALTEVTTLASVQTFSPAIAESFKQAAVVSVLMSFLLILIYIWVRFGSVRYSAAAIACLAHDVLTVLGLIALCEIIYEHESWQTVARTIGILPFKIDLNLVAAILTIIGYSLNDTIIIMDRIRENRGKLPYASAKVINNAVNQTISRTIITSGTTLLAALILYIWGGEGVRAFSFALVAGVGVGTYSSIAVAAPLVWSRKTGGPVSDGPERLTT